MRGIVHRTEARKEREMNINNLAILFAGIMIGANFTVIILAFMGAGKDVDSETDLLRGEQGDR